MGLVLVFMKKSMSGPSGVAACRKTYRRVLKNKLASHALIIVVKQTTPYFSHNIPQIAPSFQAQQHVARQC